MKEASEAKEKALIFYSGKYVHCVSQSSISTQKLSIVETLYNQPPPHMQGNEVSTAKVPAVSCLRPQLYFVSRVSGPEPLLNFFRQGDQVRRFPTRPPSASITTHVYPSPFLQAPKPNFTITVDLVSKCGCGNDHTMTPMLALNQGSPGVLCCEPLQCSLPARS